MSTESQRPRSRPRAVIGGIGRWSLVVVVLVLALVGFLHLTRGTAVQHVQGVAAEGVPIGVSEPQFPVVVTTLTDASILPGHDVEVTLKGKRYLRAPLGRSSRRAAGGRRRRRAVPSHPLVNAPPRAEPVARARRHHRQPHWVDGRIRHVVSLFLHRDSTCSPYLHHGGNVMDRRLLGQPRTASCVTLRARC